MAEIKWVKITTDIFDNRKIKYLRKRSGGNDIVLIWIMLLTIAGRCNSNGAVFLTENIPYDEEMLADELGFDVDVMKDALNQLEKLEMIYTNESYIFITGWEEHQNIEGLEKIREQTKARVAKHREKQKNVTVTQGNATSNVTVTQGNATSNVTVTQGNAIEKDKEIEVDKDISPMGEMPPTLDEIEAEIIRKGLKVKAETFYTHYSSQGWIKTNGLPVTDWRAELQLWSIREGERKNKGSTNRSRSDRVSDRISEVDTWQI